MRKRKDIMTTPLFAYSSEFLTDYLPNQLNRSDKTVISYRNCLRLLRDYIEETTNKNFYKLTLKITTRDFILHFLKWIDDRGCSVSTRNQRLACIKSYSRYIMECDFDLATWAIKIISIPFAKANEPNIGWIRETALKSIFKQPKNTPIGRRDGLMMMLMYETAARASELLGLRIKDLNLFDSGSSILLHGKGDKYRELPLGDKIVVRIKLYLQEFHPNMNKDSFLFFTVIYGTKNKMSIGNLERLVTKYANLARVEDSTVPIRVTPHMYRHSRSMNLLKVHTPYELIARFLGHSNLKSTQIYAKYDIEMLREASDRVVSITPEMQDEALWDFDEDMLSKLCGLE